MKRKLFGIGFPRTGTSSLHQALQMLGYKSLHFADDERTAEQIKAADYRLDVLDHHDAVSDTPIPAIFAQLDATWPGSKFILTTRNLDSWIRSCRHAAFNHPGQRPAPGCVREYYRTLLYGAVAFQEDRFAWVYRRHLRDVKAHFSGANRKRLLVLDFTEGDGWTKLCRFLKRPVPSEPFPHQNRSRFAESLSIR